MVGPLIESLIYSIFDFNETFLVSDDWEETIVSNKFLDRAI